MHASYYLLAILVSVGLSPEYMHSIRNTSYVFLIILYPGMHRSLACHSHSPEQAQRVIHFKPAFKHLQHPTQPFVQPQLINS